MNNGPTLGGKVTPAYNVRLLVGQFEMAYVVGDSGVRPARSPVADNRRPGIPIKWWMLLKSARLAYA